MKQMKIRYLIILTIPFLHGCNNDDDGTDLIGNWAERSVFDGTPRSGASAFTIGDVGYMGTGYDGDDYLTDFWAYDMNGDFWSQKADFPGSGRSAAVGFAINEKGYIGTGYDGNTELADFYAYNSANNTWDSIADFAGTSRRSAVAFNSSNLGYVGTGFDGDNDKKDFWQYDPNTDTWSEVSGFGGNKRRDAIVFTIGETTYLGTGVSNGLLEEDFWAFNMSSQQWTRKRDLDDEDEDLFLLRSDASAFAIGNKGYLAVGVDGSGTVRTVWAYTPETDTWEEKTSFENTARNDGIVFSNGSRAFLGLGRNGILYLDDLYEFFPNQEENEDD